MVMKRLFFILSAVIAISFVLLACKKEDPILGSIKIDEKYFYLEQVGGNIEWKCSGK